MLDIFLELSQEPEQRICKCGGMYNPKIEEMCTQCQDYADYYINVEEIYLFKHLQTEGK